MMKFPDQELPSLITVNASEGLKLAGELASQLYSQINSAADQAQRPGGMNYLLPAPVPKEVIASVLFYTIAAANGGWGGIGHLT